jgi:hypothetical protein
MAIILNNGVTNINSTPGINSDIFANRPAATDVATGTIFIATNTGAIYQSNGATWVTLGGGGGPTPGIDSVLAVGQLFTTGRTIDANTNFLHIDNITNFRVRSGGIDVIRHNSGSGTRIGDASSILQVETTGILTSAPAPNNQQGFLFNWAARSYSFGNYGLSGNRTKLDILDTTEQVYFSNAGVTNGLYLDLANDVYKFGKLNVGTEQAISIDYFNQQTQATWTGLPNGFLLDFSTNTFKFGGIDNTVTQDLYLQLNQNINTAFLYYNGNDNGLYFDFNAATRKFYFGDYQATYNGTAILLDDYANSVTIKSSQSTGSTNIEGNEISFIGANFQAAASSGSSGQYLVIVLNGTNYHIPLDNP